MENRVAFIGFGEAAQAFCGEQKDATAWKAISCTAFDVKTETVLTAPQKRNDYAALGIHGKPTLKDALAQTQIILSLVTADQALNAAKNASAYLTPGSYYFDMNSVAPTTKIAAAKLIEAAGGKYVDVAVMAPVHPARLFVPLLISGPHSESALTVLFQLGFVNISEVGNEVGRASSIKMIRSVVIKGMEALTAECVFAAEKADVLPEVLNSLGKAWAEQADYNFERMMVHGLRRAAEMKEVSITLNALGVDNSLTSGTVKWQERIGGLGVSAPQLGLNNKLLQIKTSEQGINL
ncbi:MAG: 6-phosphogluconate dehydrogenase [Robiginitomaculum sp.]|nr:MAG: 6-phosphogluconate dehydrogenase [Robiginitomaculum sp.]